MKSGIQITRSLVKRMLFDARSIQENLELEESLTSLRVKLQCKWTSQHFTTLFASSQILQVCKPTQRKRNANFRLDIIE